MLVTIGYIDYRQKAIFLKILMRFGFYSNMKSQVLWARILSVIVPGHNQGTADDRCNKDFG